jgi:hypothetical protein
MPVTDVPGLISAETPLRFRELALILTGKEKERNREGGISYRSHTYNGVVESPPGKLRGGGTRI